jgi:hypothetical protein
MYVTIVPNRNSKPASLLRESYRDGGKVKNRTLANLSHLAPDVIDVIKRALAGEKMVSAEQAVQTERTTPAGHVRAVLGTMKKLGIADLLSTRGCRERDLLLGMIAERVLHPTSKLGTVRLWKSSTLASELGVEDAKAEELYGALDWLLARQGRIEDKLAARHLAEGGLALYDVSNSHYEGRTCPLAHIGHDKDGRRGVSVIAYGVMTDREGRPVGMEVYPGNTGDPTTVPDQVIKLRARFGLEHVILVGDRGTLTNAKIEYVKEHPGLGWISALRSDAIRKLVDGEALQLSLFDQVNLAEIVSPDFPGERLVACFNPLLADDRKRKRGELLDATEKLLGKLAAEVAGRTKKPMKAAEIGLKVGRILYRHKMAKHLDVEIADGALTWTRDEQSIRREAELDGIYVIRTSEPTERLSAEDTVRSYKRLAEVEQAFRCMKGIDLRVRPVFLRDEDHVRAHFFMCMLAYYVEWQMRRALAPLLFQDEDVAADRETRDAVAKPEPSPSVKAKKKGKQTPDGLPVHSFGTLLTELATQARVTYRVGAAETTFDQLAKPTPLHQLAFDLLGV